MPDPDRQRGLRERKKYETHRALASATVRLAAERGLENVTVEEIAAEVGVSGRTFFNYFASKEDAVLLPDPDHDQRTRDLAQRLIDTPAGPSTMRVLGDLIIAEAGRLQHEQDDWLARMKVIQDNSALIGRLINVQMAAHKVTVEAVATRMGLHPERDFQPNLLVGAMEGAFRAAAEHWYQCGGARPITDFLTVAIDKLCQGFDKGDQ